MGPIFAARIDGLYSGRSQGLKEGSREGAGMKSPPPTLTDYPNPPSLDPLSLDPHQQLLIVARHSPCLEEGCDCQGWKPGRSKSTNCQRCGHELDNHGMKEVENESQERARRVKVASRIDELLHVTRLNTWIC